ncbi:MAG: hypothetical protein HC912_05775 [Saprospiraceae bacterium]|nr:hypothetical protein [Saprospiraceae bacterium]
MEQKAFRIYLQQLTKADNANLLYDYFLKHKQKSEEQYWQKEYIIQWYFLKNQWIPSDSWRMR